LQGIRRADELLSKLTNGADATSIADPRALEALRARIKQLQAEEARAGAPPSFEIYAILTPKIGCSPFSYR
jgi:hypothetical protein